MPKLKTRKGVVKRVRFSAKGKAKANRAGRRHLAGSKTAKRKQKLRTTVVIKGELGKNLARMALVS